MAERILVVDDEREIRRSCQRILEDGGYTVQLAADGESGLRLLADEEFALMLLDLRLPGKDGLEVLREARSLEPGVSVVIFTAYATIETAVEAMRGGAFNYLAKPFTAEQLLQSVERALEHRRLHVGPAAGSESAEEGFDGILGTAQPMRRIFELMQKVSDSDASVLITGETGTGKELIARTIHGRSGRVNGPFVPVDCAALPEQLLESELFGHEKGAFTGAETSKKGLLECAAGGTLFLDEVGDLPLSLQPKLLRTLQERVVRRLGSRRLSPVDIRVLAATNQDLQLKSRDGSFREELYFRLNVVHINVPPLRERRSDISLLAHHFLLGFGEDYRKPVSSFAPDAVTALLAYGWPGNVRELRNAVERAVLVAATPVIQLADLPETILRRDGPSHPSFEEVHTRGVLEVEKPYLVELLNRHQGNVSAAAEEAGLARKKIYRMAKKLGIDIESFRR